MITAPTPERVSKRCAWVRVRASFASRSSRSRTGRLPEARPSTSERSSRIAGAACSMFSEAEAERIDRRGSCRTPANAP